MPKTGLEGGHTHTHDSKWMLMLLNKLQRQLHRCLRNHEDIWKTHKTVLENRSNTLKIDYVRLVALDCTTQYNMAFLLFCPPCLIPPGPTPFALSMWRSEVIKAEWLTSQHTEDGALWCSLQWEDGTTFSDLQLCLYHRVFLREYSSVDCWGGEWRRRVSAGTSILNVNKTC